MSLAVLYGWLNVAFFLLQSTYEARNNRIVVTKYNALLLMMLWGGRWLMEMFDRCCAEELMRRLP
jgi:hypothetical protein